MPTTTLLKSAAYYTYVIVWLTCTYVRNAAAIVFNIDYTPQMTTVKDPEYMQLRTCACRAPMRSSRMPKGLGWQKSIRCRLVQVAPRILICWHPRRCRSATTEFHWLYMWQMRMPISGGWLLIFVLLPVLPYFGAFQSSSQETSAFSPKKYINKSKHNAIFLSVPALSRPSLPATTLFLSIYLSVLFICVKDRSHVPHFNIIASSTIWRDWRVVELNDVPR